MPIRLITQDLVAEGDGVVVKTSGQMPIDRQLVIVHRLADVADTPVQVANAVVECEIYVPPRFLVRLDGKLVRFDRTLPVLALLEVAGSLPVPGSVAHPSILTSPTIRLHRDRITTHAEPQVSRVALAALGRTAA